MCGCVASVNKRLAERNTKLAQGFCLTEDLSGADLVLIIATEKANKRDKRRPITVLATFCPFCGKQIPRTDSKHTATEAA